MHIILPKQYCLNLISELYLFVCIYLPIRLQSQIVPSVAMGKLFQRNRDVTNLYNNVKGRGDQNSYFLIIVVDTSNFMFLFATFIGFSMPVA